MAEPKIKTINRFNILFINKNLGAINLSKNIQYKIFF